MRLGNRITLALLVIVVTLSAPALYGLFALRDLAGIARNLRTRDAVGALALGRLQQAFGEVEHRQRVYVALGGTASPAERQEARAQVEASIQRVEQELEGLSAAGYRQATAPALRQWGVLREAIRQEQEMVEEGRFEEQEQFRNQAVIPAFQAMTQALAPIGAAINRAGQEEVARAQRVASRAATTELIALAIALALAIAAGAVLTRSILRPIHELRRGMAVVAEGEFDPEVRVPPDRPDELGDLARSFNRMTDQLAELDRLKAEFISIASHELKTPLSVIRGYVSLLLEGIYGDLTDEQRKPLTSVIDQTDRLGRLVQQLLEISRFEAGGGRLDFRPVEVGPFLAKLAGSFDPLAMQNEVDFQVEIADTLPDTIIGDRDRLEEVVGNLLSNAFKFTPRGGGDPPPSGT